MKKLTVAISVATGLVAATVALASAGAPNAGTGPVVAAQQQCRVIDVAAQGTSSGPAVMQVVPAHCA